MSGGDGKVDNDDESILFLSFFVECTPAVLAIQMTLLRLIWGSDDLFGEIIDGDHRRGSNHRFVSGRVGVL